MSQILIMAFALEGISFVILLVSAILLLTTEGKNPGFIESFVVGQVFFFNMGVMFHLGYLTALVRRK